MNKLKKMFFEQNITWKKLIIFSIICGLITGVIPLIKAFDNTSIHNIAECYEMWVFLALFIILNSKKPLEAGLKTFVFFLISQPLCYLVQVPFYRDGFGIFIYYKYWAFLTLLTIPGAIVTWYSKKDNLLSILIYSIVLFLLNLELCTHINTLIKEFPYQILAVIFIILEIIIFIKLIFNNKKNRVILYIISILLLISLSIWTIKRNEDNKNPYYVAFYTLDNNEYELVNSDDNVIIELEDGVLRTKTKYKGEYIITLKDKNNKLIEFIFIVSGEETTLNKNNN